MKKLILTIVAAAALCAAVSPANAAACSGPHDPDAGCAGATIVAPIKCSKGFRFDMERAECVLIPHNTKAQYWECVHEEGKAWCGKEPRR